jgi:hypothetical protein
MLYTFFYVVGIGHVPEILRSKQHKSELLLKGSTAAPAKTILKPSSCDGAVVGVNRVLVVHHCSVQARGWWLVVVGSISYAHAKPYCNTSCYELLNLYH